MGSTCDENCGIRSRGMPLDTPLLVLGSKQKPTSANALEHNSKSYAASPRIADSAAWFSSSMNIRSFFGSPNTESSLLFGPANFLALMAAATMLALRTSRLVLAASVALGSGLNSESNSVAGFSRATSGCCSVSAATCACSAPFWLPCGCAVRCVLAGTACAWGVPAPPVVGWAVGFAPATAVVFAFGCAAPFMSGFFS